MLTLSTIMQISTERLKNAGIDNPQLDARLLVGHALSLSRTEMLVASDRVLRDAEVETINALITRRAAREPVARILGVREFWGLPFALNEATLEPRPDTETLVEVVLKNADHTKPYRILDLGTGTGCILLSLLHEMPNATGVGVDIAPRAVEQARANADNLGLTPRAQFETGNWFDGVAGMFDIITSNPPYIADNVIPTLMPEVRAHDPVLALSGGSDGLAPYRTIASNAAKHMNKGGMLALEIGFDQAKAVTALLQENHFTNIATHNDLGGNARVVLATIV